MKTTDLTPCRPCGEGHPLTQVQIRKAQAGKTRQGKHNFGKKNDCMICTLTHFSQTIGMRNLRKMQTTKNTYARKEHCKLENLPETDLFTYS